MNLVVLRPEHTANVSQDYEDLYVMLD